MLTHLVKRLLVTWQHPENRLFDDGALLVNQDGHQFCDATKWPEREIAVSRQPGKIAYILLDESLTDRYSRWPHFISTAPEIAYAYVQDYLRLRPDVAVSGASLEQVAKQRGIPIENLRPSADAGAAPARDSNRRDGRWTLLGPVKAYFTTTEGGLACDGDFRVLRDDGWPIEGLYAVGQVGLNGQILWGHGLHIAWAMTSGRLAGKVVSKKVPHPPKT
jgi:fumarate reductase flavoprotein subunit